MFLWSPIAQASYIKTLIYLSDNESTTAASQFNQYVENLLSDITTLNATASRFSIYYRYSINQFCTITYIPTADVVEIVAFYDRRIKDF